MVEHKQAATICYFLLSALLFSMVIPIPSEVISMEEATPFSLSEDTLRPEISNWSFTKEARRGEPFEAWADVSDTESGVRNVTLVVEPSSSNKTKHLLNFNGSLYVSEIAALQMNRTYDLYIQAFDNANNSATSYIRTVDLRIPSTTAIDPKATLVPVVVSSFLLGVLVIFLACVYDRRNTQDQPA